MMRDFPIWSVNRPPASWSRSATVRPARKLPRDRPGREENSLLRLFRESRAWGWQLLATNRQTPTPLAAHHLGLIVRHDLGHLRRSQRPRCLAGGHLVKVMNIEVRREGIEKARRGLSGIAESMWRADW